MKDYLAKAIAGAAESKAMPFSNVQVVPGRVLHIDGDYAAYYCSGKDGTPIGLARRNVLDRIEKGKRAAGAASVEVHLTAGDSHKGHRYLIASERPYQGQRNAGRKPDNWHALREFMEGYEGGLFDTVVWSDREADDGIAYKTAAQLAAGKSPAIHTRDKDMRMFGGLHIEWQTFAAHAVAANEYESYDRDGLLYGHKWFWTQMLTGDNADHIAGLKGVGKGAAPRILKGTRNNEEAFAVVEDLYRAKIPEEMWADYFVEQAALLWMRVDYRADIDNFLTVVPHTEEIVDARDRLHARVSAGLQRIEEYSLCSG
jgi:hypothetical protein